MAKVDLNKQLAMFINERNSALVSLNEKRIKKLFRKWGFLIRMTGRCSGPACTCRSLRSTSAVDVASKRSITSGQKNG